MAKIKLRNESKYEFVDISSESVRIYNFPIGCDGELKHNEVVIRSPQWLSVSKAGHRIVDLAGGCIFVPYGWISVEWMPKSNKPHFVL